MAEFVLIISEDAARVRPLAMELAQSGYRPEIDPRLPDPARLLARRPVAIYLDASNGHIPDALGTLLRSARPLPPVYLLTSNEPAIATLAVAPLARAWEPLTSEPGEDPTRVLGPADLRELTRFARTVTATRDSGDLIDRLVAHILTGVAADRASILDVEPALSIARVRASSAGAAARGIPLDLHKYPEIERGVREWKAVLVEDIEADPQMADSLGPLRARGVRSVLAVPFAPRKDGALCVLVSRRVAFTARDRAYVRFAAQLTGSVLEIIEALEGVEHQDDGRRETTAAIRERWRRLVEDMPGGFAEIAEDGTLLVVSENLANLLERPKQELAGQPLIPLLDFVSRARWEAAAREAQQQPGHVIRFEIPLPHALGSSTVHEVVLWFTERGHHLFALFSEHPGQTATYRAEVWQELHESGPEPRAVIAPDGRIAVANRIFRDWFDADRGDALFGPGREPPFEPDLLARALLGETFVSVAVRTGVDRPPIAAMLTPVRDVSGQTAGVEIIGRTGSIRRDEALQEIEAALREKVAELRVANQQLQDMDIFRKHFISAAAHELKTPITILKSYVEVLMGDLAEGLTDKQRSFLQTVWETSGRLERLVSDLLDLASLEAGHLVFMAAPHPVEPLVRRVIGEAQPLAARADVTLALTPGGPAKIVVDEDRFAQVLTNLVVNALRYTPAGGRAELRWEVETDTVMFQISDTGPGIPADDLPYIFEEFRQVARGARRKLGTGLGLAICKRFTEAMGGTVEIKSEIGRGTTAIVRIPRTLI
jgi:signal transduction histidine kinase